MRLAAATLLCVAALGAGPSVLRATFAVPAGISHTSAGIFLNESKLVRTLWSRRATHAPGEHDEELLWDGLDDDGVVFAASAAAAIAPRVLGFSINYTWEGVVGNSIGLTGPRIPKGYTPIMGLAIAGDVAVLCAGYGERVRTMFIFNASAPTAAPSFRSLGHMDYHSTYDHCATDGALAVFFNSGVPAPVPSYYNDNATFVVGYDLHADVFDPSVPPICEHNFTIGGRLSCQDGYGQQCNVLWDGCSGHEQTYSSALDWNQSALIDSNATYGDAATGLAVQPDGALVIVLHGLGGEMRAFDKVTGARVRSWSDAALLGARSLALPARGGGDRIWALTADRGVCVFAGLGSDAPLARVCPLAAGALLDPDALAISPDGGSLLVTDVDAASQQVKLFDATSGALLRVFGRAGGYVAPGADIAVAPDRFWFAPSQANASGLPHGRTQASVVAFSPDGGSFWVSDEGNRRLLRIRIADGAAIDELAWLLCSYKSAAVAAEPSRIFSNYLEFSVRADVPLDAPGAYELVANWGAGLNASFFAWDFGVNACDGWAFAGFDSVVTIADASGLNRTFSTVGYHPFGRENCSGSTTALVELVRGGSPAAALCPAQGAIPPTGGLRLIHLVSQPRETGLGTFEPDGSLRFPVTVNDAAAGSHWQGIYARRPAFDAEGCASWVTGAPAPGIDLLASFNISANNSLSLMARGSSASSAAPIVGGGRRLYACSPVLPPP